jgi:hypothetical protein
MLIEAAGKNKASMELRWLSSNFLSFHTTDDQRIRETSLSTELPEIFLTDSITKAVRVVI